MKKGKSGPEPHPQSESIAERSGGTSGCTGRSSLCQCSRGNKSGCHCKTSCVETKQKNRLQNKKASRPKGFDDGALLKPLYFSHCNSTVGGEGGYSVGYSADVTDADSEMFHDIPHTFRIESDSYQVTPVVPTFAEQATLNTPQHSQLFSLDQTHEAGNPSRTTATLIQLPPTVPHPPLQQQEQHPHGTGFSNITHSFLPPPLVSDPTIVLDTTCQPQPLFQTQKGQQKYRIVPLRQRNNLAMEDTKPPTSSGISPPGASSVPAVSPVIPTSAISDFPSNTKYPGPYQFEIFFTKAQESESKKTISYIYSPEEHKLYVRMKVHCPIHFKVGRVPPVGTRIRAIVIYSRPQDVGDVVKRCMNHIVEDKDVAYKEHLVRCHNPVGVDYDEIGPSRRHSVSIPWEVPAAGSDYITGIYEFTCFSSCSGTINRRPTQMIFTLEHNDGEVLGRQVVELRICACPGRDIVLSEGNGPPPSAFKRKAGNLNKMEPLEEDTRETVHAFTSLEPISKKPRNNEIYTIQVRGRELYKIVMTIIRNYEISRRYEELAPIFRQMQGLQSEGMERVDGNGDFASPAGNSQIHSNRLRSLLPEQMQPDTSIYDWLVSLELSDYGPHFTEMGLYTLEDLEGVMTVELLNRLGMSEEDRDRLFGAYIQWKSVRQSSQPLSSLSSLASQESLFSTLLSASSPPHSQQTNNEGFRRMPMGEGYRVAKTRVVTTYKVPKKRGAAGRPTLKQD